MTASAAEAHGRDREQGPGAMAADARLRGAGLFIELEKRVRRCEDETALRFFVVNETVHLVRYRQALLWRAGESGGGGAPVAASGLAAVDANAPFVQWAGALCDELAAVQPPQAVRAFTARDVSPTTAQDWGQWLPEHAIFLRLQGRAGRLLGGLLLARDEPWGEAESHLLAYLADAYGHAWGALKPESPALQRLRFFRRRWQAVMAAAALVLALFPVSQTALAPARLIPIDPAVVRAPIDGVVDRFAVSPNTMVKKGDVLLYLDSTKLDSRLKVVQKALEVEAAELRQAEQQALIDEASRVRLAVLRNRVQQQTAEVEYVRGLLERSTVRSPRDGMAVFDDVNEWIGKPVALGERILTVADPARAEIELRLPVADALTLKDEARVRMFLNTAPHKPVDGLLRYASYEANPTPEGFFAYRLVARITDERGDLRIGLKGTAKVYGEQTLLIVHLLRKPFAAVRQYLGV